MKFLEQTRQVCDQIERREIRCNEIRASAAIERGAGQELRVAAGVERDSAGFDKCATGDREVLAHSRVDVVGPDREAVLGIEARVDSRSRAEVIQQGARVRNSLRQVLKSRLRAP